MRLIYLVYFAVCGYLVYDLTTAKADCEEAALRSLLHGTFDNNAKDKCDKMAAKGKAVDALLGH